MVSFLFSVKMAFKAETSFGMILEQIIVLGWIYCHSYYSVYNNILYNYTTKLFKV